LLDTLPLYRKAGIEMDVLLLWDNNQPFTVALKVLNCCKVIVLNESDNYRDIYAISNIFKLRTYLKEYDIVHVHLFPALYFVRLASLGLPINLLFTEHNTSNKRINNKIFKFLEKWCYKGYQKVICISDEIKLLYSHYLNLPERLIVIENGINLDAIFSAKCNSKSVIDKSIHEEDVMLLQVSAFRMQKDQDTLIKALPFLPSHFKVVLVGDGERKNDLISLVKTLGLEKRVLFLGLRMDVFSLLKSVDLVVLSSYYEGLSLASVEGMASGKPFVASNVPGLKEVVEGAGVLFEQGNAEELASIILGLMNNQQYYIQVANACQERAKQYDINKMVAKHIELYYEVFKN
jgi:glycosyltransferase involved in cell wall biosynthesis